MNFIDVLLVGLALSMDAFAITIANCITYKKTLSRKQEWCMPLFFGIFQGMMPLLGFYIGSAFADYLASVAGYLTATIFFVLAFKIVFDNVKEIKSKSSESEKCGQILTYKMLLLQALATSIDAFAVGITFAVGLAINIYLAVVIIIAVTLIMITIALLFGKLFGKIFGAYAQWGGAIILFGLAIKEFIKAII